MLVIRQLGLTSTLHLVITNRTAKFHDSDEQSRIRNFCKWWESILLVDPLLVYFDLIRALHSFGCDLHFGVIRKQTDCSDIWRWQKSDDCQGHILVNPNQMAEQISTPSQYVLHISIPVLFSSSFFSFSLLSSVLPLSVSSVTVIDDAYNRICCNIRQP